MVRETGGRRYPWQYVTRAWGHTGPGAAGPVALVIGTARRTA
jgi:hypothetical protein